ncbi:MAG: DUF433 domain-containing protein [Thermofilum sp.]|jgi:uncharacterized protein (DUF433 family)|nr:DUF433 domain-containing protein [Thermofilum sp.]
MRLEIGRYIVVDDEVCHGKPVFKGTRILVSDVIELLGAGVSIEEIIKDYYPSLNEEMIREALRWAAEIIRGKHYVRYVEIST